MPVEHLLKQAEIYGRNRERKDRRPQWLSELIENTAELLEPTQGEGRVGFQATPEGDGWHVVMYLGQREQVGGPHDGQAQPTDFVCDLQTLQANFESVQQLRWVSLPSSHAEESPVGGGIEVIGMIEATRVRLCVSELPPEEVEAGVKEYQF